MALASTQLDAVPATRVIAMAGRFAEAPLRAPPQLRLHLLHGEQDAVMPLRLAIEAGRLAFEAGRMPRREWARPTSPVEGRVGE